MKIIKRLTPRYWIDNLTQFPLSLLYKNYENITQCFVLELVPLWSEHKSEPRPQNEFLIYFGGSFKIYYDHHRHLGVPRVLAPLSYTSHWLFYLCSTYQYVFQLEIPVNNSLFVYEVQSIDDVFRPSDDISLGSSRT